MSGETLAKPAASRSSALHSADKYPQVEGRALRDRLA